MGRDRVADVQRDQHAARSRQRSEAVVRDSGPPRRDVPGENREPDQSTATVPKAHARPADPQLASAEDRPAQGRSWLDSIITLTVAVVAAAASYGHMLEVAVWAGEPLWIAKAFPITVDGLVLAALRRGRQGRWRIALGIAVSRGRQHVGPLPRVRCYCGAGRLGMASGGVVRDAPPPACSQGF